MSGSASKIKGSSTFPRGIHPPEWKDLAADAPIEVLPVPNQVSVPLLQHLGALCEATVKARDVVGRGDVVGQSAGFVSAPVHSSVAGTVGRPVMVTLPNGRHVPAVSIQADAEQPLAGRDLFEAIYGGEWPTDEIGQMEPTRIATAAQEAGLVGLGGAAFPTHVKLALNNDKPIRTVLINGCECEPYLTADYRLMLEAPRPILAGALLARRATGADEVRICIEDNKPEAIRAMREACEGTGVEVFAMKTKYPQGGEKQLVWAALRKEVPAGGLPLDVGVVVMNVSTAAALADAVFRGFPLTHRVITVTGRGIRRPANILAPIGASYQDLIDACGGLTEDAARVLSGGPMMGLTVPTLETPVTKGASGITILTDADVRQSKETSCVRCGRCVDVCPMILVPTRIALSARAGRLDLAQRYYLSSCIECGCCSYVCPASIPLAQLIRAGKSALQKAIAQKKKSGAK